MSKLKKQKAVSKEKPVRAVEEAMITKKLPDIRFSVGTKISCVCCSATIAEFVEDVVRGDLPKLSQLQMIAIPKPGVSQHKWHCQRCGEPFINDVGEISTIKGWI